MGLGPRRAWARAWTLVALLVCASALSPRATHAQRYPAARTSATARANATSRQRLPVVRTQARPFALSPARLAARRGAPLARAGRGAPAHEPLNLESLHVADAAPSAAPGPALDARPAERAALRRPDGPRELRHLATELDRLVTRFDPLVETSSRMPDPSPRANRTFIRQMGPIRRQLARVDVSRLRDDELVTYAAIEAECQYAELLDRTRAYTWNVNTMEDLHHAVRGLGMDGHTIDDRRSVNTLIARYRQLPQVFARRMNALRQGARVGRVVPRVVRDGVVAQLDGMIAHPELFVGVLATRPSGMSARDFAQAREDVGRAVREHVVPALEAYRTFVQQLPARESVGLADMPDAPNLPSGREVYMAYVRYHTGTDQTPEQVHALGLEQVQQIRAQMRPLAKAVLRHPGRLPLKQALARIASLPSQQVRGERVLEQGRTDTRRVLAELSTELGAGPGDVLPIEVRPAPPGNEGGGPEYLDGELDGDGRVVRPGVTSIDMETPLPASTLETLFVHESGAHHLQWSFSAKRQEHELVGMVSRPSTVVEGGALYTEMYAYERRFFRTRSSQLGHLSDRMQRAVRLVVDTGIHAMGWSREQAIQYMQDNTILDRATCEQEIDRYIAWPGQALSYMTGALELQAMRDQLRRELGGRFDLPGFHRVVLANASAPMSSLRTIVERWAKDRAQQPAN